MAKSGAERSKLYYQRNKAKILARRNDDIYVKTQKENLQNWRKKNPWGFKADGLSEIQCLQKYLWLKAKTRAKIFKRAFEIVPEDIVIPDVCPILGIKLTRNVISPQKSSPSLDRINSDLGYTKTNIGVISHEANRLKSNCSYATLKKLLEWMEQTPPTQ